MLLQTTVYNSANYFINKYSFYFINLQFLYRWKPSCRLDPERWKPSCCLDPERWKPSCLDPERWKPSCLDREISIPKGCLFLGRFNACRKMQLWRSKCSFITFLFWSCKSIDKKHWFPSIAVQMVVKSKTVFYYTLFVFSQYFHTNWKDTFSCFQLHFFNSSTTLILSLMSSYYYY
jgi:hypothetical protein